MKKVGIITFHNSYNCGSMLESYAIQESVKKYCTNYVEIINFSNDGQKEIYSEWFPSNSIKNIIKNILLIKNHKKIKINNSKYEEFKNKNFKLSKKYNKIDDLDDSKYDVVVCGSDQIWNITIKDGDDAYFLPWVKNAKKVAYAPSFGSKKIQKYTDNTTKYKAFLNSFDALSIRENNGKKWLKELIGQDVPVLIDPTLILDKNDYEKIMANDIEEKQKYIFFYSPGFEKNICKFVKKIADKYSLKVIVWSTKPYSVKLIGRFGFELPKYENPSSYLYYIKNAELIMTTSYHGTIFSTIFNKKFITIKNGGMYGDDDRVKTLLEQIGMMNRCIPFDFDEKFNYLGNVDYSEYNSNIKQLRENAINYLIKNIGDKNETNK